MYPEESAANFSGVVKSSVFVTAAPCVQNHFIDRLKVLM
jgi:hypothetical protein